MHPTIGRGHQQQADKIALISSQSGKRVIRFDFYAFTSFQPFLCFSYHFIPYHCSCWSHFSLVQTRTIVIMIAGAARGLRPRDANKIQPVDTNKPVAGLKGALNKENPALKGGKESIKPQPLKGVSSNAIVKPKLQYSASTGRRLSKIPVPAKVATVQEVSPKSPPPSVEDIDKDDGDNVFLAPEYVNDIYRYLRKLEVRSFVIVFMVNSHSFHHQVNQSLPSDFLSIQREMTPKMRSVLVDWLVNVHTQFRLLPETLYLAISVMDRFFSLEVVGKDKIQLVGVTAFFVAAKFEEIYPPTIDDLVAICDNLYGRRDIIKMEMAIVKRLRFDMGHPLPLHFLRRNSKAAHASPKIHTLAKYLMELTLLDHECSSWPSSLQAATALFVTLKVMSTDPDNCWTPTIAYYSNYEEKDLEKYASKLCSLVVKADTSKYQNVYKKFSHPKMMEISKSPILKSGYIRNMAEVTAMEM